jgi:hypothetical protein
MHLTVKSPFSVGDKEYVRGDKIEDGDLIEKILDGDNVQHVVKTADPTDAFNGSPH